MNCWLYFIRYAICDTERYWWNLVWRAKWRQRLKKWPLSRNVCPFTWMNLSRLHQRRKMRISKRRIKLRAEEGNCHGILFKLLLGQQCWSYLTLQDLHEWNMPVLCSGQHQRPDPVLIGLLLFVWGDIMQLWAVSWLIASILFRLSKHWSHTDIHQRWTLFYLKPGKFGTDRWSKWWIPSICHSPSSCVELLLVVWTACFARAHSKTAKHSFRQ